jgi:hypothetical protein
LRFGTHDNAWEQVVVSPDNAVPRQRYVVFKPSARADFYVGSDHAMMAHAHVVIKFGSRVNYRCVGDHSGHLESAFQAILM